jgi:hypothetical protein
MIRPLLKFKQSLSLPAVVPATSPRSDDTIWVSHRSEKEDKDDNSTDIREEDDLDNNVPDSEPWLDSPFMGLDLYGGRPSVIPNTFPFAQPGATEAVTSTSASLSERRIRPREGQLSTGRHAIRKDEGNEKCREIGQLGRLCFLVSAQHVFGQ